MQGQGQLEDLMKQNNLQVQIGKGDTGTITKAQTSDAIYHEY